MIAGRKKPVTLLLVLVTIVSSYFLVALPPEEQFAGWVVREGDEVRYYVEAELNSGSTYVARLLDEYGVSSGSTLTIRAADVPSDVDVSAIAESLSTLNGIVEVQQQTGQEWTLLNSSLPFFLPVGYWSSIEQTMSQYFDVTMEEEWWGEISFTTSHSSSELGDIELFLAWELQDGVLQGMTINASAHDGWDFVRLALSGQSLAYTSDLDWLGPSVGRSIMELLILAGIFGPGFLFGILWQSELRLRLLPPLSGTLAERLDTYGTEYFLFWSLGALVTVITAFLTSLLIEESILPVIQSYFLSFLLATLVSLYRARKIDHTPPMEHIQYAMLFVSVSIGRVFIFSPEVITNPITYVLPLVMIVGLIGILVIMHPLRALRIKVKQGIDEIEDVSPPNGEDHPNEYSL